MSWLSKLFDSIQRKSNITRLTPSQRAAQLGTVKPNGKLKGEPRRPIERGI